MNKIVIGLTGGICSGKTVAAEFFKANNFYIIDTDIISREVIAKGSAGERELKQLFPKAFLGGVLDRSKLKSIVFEDNTELQKLNSLMHPLIHKRAMELIKKTGESRIILVAPLLIETGFDKLTDKVITVSCDEEKRIQRLIRRDNIDRALAEKIIANQLSDSEREKRADYCLNNNNGIEYLKEQIDDICKIL